MILSKLKEGNTHLLKNKNSNKILLKFGADISMNFIRQLK